MSSRSVILLASIVISSAALFSAEAGGDKIVFPEHYAKGVKWLVVDKPQFKRVHEYYAPPEAVEAARQNEPMPEGTVLVGLQYQIKHDDKGNPILGPDGHFIKTDLSAYVVMEKRAGWGAEYPRELRNGEWEYQIFNADKTPNKSVKLDVCFECHKPFAERDYVQAYDKLQNGSQ